MKQLIRMESEYMDAQNGNSLKRKAVLWCILICLIMAALVLVVFFLSDENCENELPMIDIINETPYGYVPVISSTKVIQLGNNCIYFAGDSRGIFKYDLETGEVSEFCNDPLCGHRIESDSCYLGEYHCRQYFRAFSNVLLYNCFISDYENQKSVNCLYAYEPDTIRNIIIDDYASTSNQYCVSENYAYFNNVIKKDGKTYFNHKQVKLSDGSVKIFGEETEGKTRYTLVGAINGYLFANDLYENVTYVCSEDNPGEYTVFWNSIISSIWAGENDLFFKARVSPNLISESEAPYYFYHTDYEGNVMSKHELVGGMKWGSIYDGKHLYYIPAEDSSFVCGDGTTRSIHSREIYLLNIDTGERSVAFTFDGDLVTMEIEFGMGNEMFVFDNKIYTYSIGEANVSYNPDTNETTVYGSGIGLRDGIVAIDMSNGDITFIQANYDIKSFEAYEFVYDIQHYEMNIEKENNN